MAKSRITSTVYSIKDLEHFSGVKAHTIRIWESRYNLFTPDRTPGNIRTYTGDDLRKMLSIASLVGHGYRISRLAGLSMEELNELVQKIMVPNDFASRIDALVADMIRFDQPAFENKLNEVINSLGFEEAVYHVIFPLFAKIGVLWQTDAVNPAQEHFVSYIIRRKMIAAIDSQATSSPGAKTFLLFLPEQEQHEMGLLLALFLIRKYGHTGIYLGQSVPTEAVVNTWAVVQPDYLLTHMTAQIGTDELEEYLKNLSGKTKGAHILVSGQNNVVSSGISIRNVKFLESPAEFKRKYLARQTNPSENKKP